MVQLVRVLSDAHQEFGPLEDIPVFPEDSKTVMVLAGDIGQATKKHTFLPLLQECEERFAQTLYVLGNHEYYDSSLLRARDKIQAVVDHAGLKKVHVWDDSGIYKRYKVVFIGATLWTDFDKADPHCMMMARGGMNDYNYIRTGPTVGTPYQRKASPADMLIRHREARPWMLDEIKKWKDQGYRTVVISHHLPSFQCIHENYRGDRGNPCYASELGNEICDLEPNVWIHGHTHEANDFMLAKTRIICNPRGYVGHQLCDEFDISKRFEV